ncbi:MAG TPA: hypothetical protein VLE47_01335 [Candidatus Saccharimonadales bacterium]|nr:hypothetical protein [Candidatus Saccharimonadales bacterium]
MPETNPTTPPSLIQDPEIGTPKPVLLSSNSNEKRKFDSTKVLAAVGVILTVTLIIVGILWITVQNLENRVNTLEDETVVAKKSTTVAVVKIASKAATSSAD